ncbi:3-phosphoshikimate 1-carboxyvinyltransferase [Nesterenkonia marinintestina]|uniref:3-phosphoshikimate 1-carboxyvinyltransferase n=1 Tax=Nesterenkonia marinintestina TaxID=2979865 RepID=UPI0021C1B652|nr:3-phosphoshikimate 1-carboxyvinyltransferase [Nesterenkonia sp. GX14115]
MRGRVVVPPSKSLTNRLLLLAALADGPSTVVNPLDSRDSRLMLEALRTLGADVTHIDDWEATGEPAVRITPLPAPALGADLPPLTIDCGLAGTVMRFLPAVAALTGRTVRFDGDPEARVRPMGTVLRALADLGAEVTGEPIGDPRATAPSTLPFTLRASGGLPGGEVRVDASGSSQFVSGLLLAAPLMPEGLTVRHIGDDVPSAEHVAMTVDVLRDLGAAVDDSVPQCWRVSPGRPQAFTRRVEPDLSNAGPFLAAAALTGGEVSVPGWPVRSTQIGRRWTEILPRFGAEVDTAPEPSAGQGGATVTLTVRGARDAEGAPVVTSPGTVDGTAELTPTVAALAALAQGPTTFTSVAHLRGHETDRIAALVTELRRLGARAEETPDGLSVLSPVDRGGTVRSYADHRMATFGAVVGLRLDHVSVEDIGCTAKTMPTFAQLWTDLVDPTRGTDA